MKVLIIEDDLDFAYTLQRGFESKGFESFHVKNLNEFEQINTSDIYTHAVIDLRLKLESGLNYISRVKEIWPDCFVVMLTAYGSISTSVDAIKKGANEYILKPCTFFELLSLLKGEEIVGDSSSNVMLDLYQKEKEYIDFVLQQTDGNISKSAEILGIRRQSLQRKLKKFTEKKIE